MKQHITENDLNQLTNSGKEKLLGWLVINEYAVLEDDNNWTFITPTIGQMIEFLDGKFINFWRGARKDWLIVIDDDTHIVKDELVDCLWEAVKHELSGVGE